MLLIVAELVISLAHFCSAARDHHLVPYCGGWYVLMEVVAGEGHQLNLQWMNAVANGYDDDGDVCD